jgi:RimJ/RimL family protein N-acetyltransferase
MNLLREQLPTPDTIPQEFTLYRGWDDQLASNLVQRSKDTEIMQWTPRDHRERFPDTTSADTWFHRISPRIIYSLFQASELAGVIWYSHSPRQDSTANYTMAIRLYESARGRRLATPLLIATETDLLQTVDAVTGIWLETDETNEAARRSYSRAGYQETSTALGRVTMEKYLSTQK